MTIHQDVENNDIEAVKAKIAKYEIALENFKNSDYKEKNFVKRAWQRYMSELPINPVNQYDRTGKPPLALVKTPAMAQLLIDAGADIDEKNSAGKTLSEIAMPGRLIPLPLFNYTKILSFLIENEAEVNEKNLSDFLKSLSSKVLMYIGADFEDYTSRFNRHDRYLQDKYFQDFERNVQEFAENNIDAQDREQNRQENLTILSKNLNNIFFKVGDEIAKEDISLIKSSKLKLAEKVESKLKFNKSITSLLKKTAKDIYSQFQEKYNIPAEILDKIIIHMNDDVNLTKLEKYKQIDHANSKILDGKKELSDKTISQKSKENIYLKSLKDYTFVERLKNAASNDISYTRG